jgi:hypothetical protein
MLWQILTKYDLQITSFMTWAFISNLEAHIPSYFSPCNASLGEFNTWDHLVSILGQ